MSASRRSSEDSPPENSADIISGTCALAEKFYQGLGSMKQLFIDLGSPQHRTAVSEDSVFLCLSKNVQFVDSWFRWSDDKRVPEGWYVCQKGKSFEVGYFPDGEKVAFDDRIRACSYFVFREVEAMARRYLNS